MNCFFYTAYPKKTHYPTYTKRKKKKSRKETPEQNKKGFLKSNP